MYRYTMGDNCMSAWLVVQQILVTDTWSQLQKYAKSKYVAHRNVIRDLDNALNMYRNVFLKFYKGQQRIKIRGRESVVKWWQSCNCS